MADSGGVDDGIGLDVVDTAPDQLHVVAPQCPQPTAVVLQGAFTGRWIVRDHLGGQLLVAVELAGDPLGEHHPGHIVGGADGTLLVRPLRVDDRRRKAGIAAGPEDQEPVPATVER